LPLTFDVDNTPLRTVFDLTSATMRARNGWTPAVPFGVQGEEFEVTSLRNVHLRLPDVPKINVSSLLGLIRLCLGWKSFSGKPTMSTSRRNIFREYFSGTSTSDGNAGRRARQMQFWKFDFSHLFVW